MWQKHFHDAWHNGKRTVGKIWNHAVKFAGDLDYTMNVGKRLFGAIHPMIEELGGRNVNQAIMSGISRYDQGRNEVMGLHNNVHAQLSKIRRAVPEIDL